MSRSGYSDDWGDQWQHIMWRGAVASAIRGRRGQQFLQELLTGLDAMPEKRLISDELEQNGEFCALGVVGQARGIDMQNIDPECYLTVAHTFNISQALAQEVAYMNDEDNPYYAQETPESRWQRMRTWVVSNIKKPETIEVKNEL